MIPKGLDRVEPSVRERCLQDDWIYLAWYFERSALTWAGDCWQRPTPEQWEELFHLPRAYTFVEGLPDCPKQRELARLRMLGNTWDVKVVRCFYYGLLESIGQPIPASFFDTVADIGRGPHHCRPVRGALGQDPARFRGHLHQVHPGAARVVSMAFPSPS